MILFSQHKTKALVWKIKIKAEYEIVNLAVSSVGSFDILRMIGKTHSEHTLTPLKAHEFEKKKRKMYQ